MRFKIGTIFIALIFFIVQPVNISKADLAGDLLKKAQELAEKQKIKGKKLEAFILSNIITVDYEGKKQTYKFNKDITYNVYENSKVIGDGTWAIKGLTKSSIKLSGYRDIYFQIYSAKDRISTLTNLKRKSDGQTNRKILKISSLDDFEKQLANPKTKKEKKKVEKELDKKDKSKKTKKKDVNEDKISNCAANNNYIYYSDVRNDKFYKRVWKFQAGGGYFEELTNFSFIVKSPDKDYEVEYIVNPKKKDNYGISGDFTAINLKDCKTKKYKFRSRENYIFMFDEANLRLEIRGGSGTWYSYYGTTCKNEQNPQCMKKLAEINLIGYRDLKNNFSYTESVDAYKNKIAEDKRLAEEKRIAEEKKQAERDKIVADKRRIAAEKQKREEEANKKRRADQEATANKPENRLYDAYTFYITIKKFYEASPIYYVSNAQMREAKSQIKVIEKILKEKDNTMNTDSIWSRAAQKIDKDYGANTMGLAATNPDKAFQFLAKANILGLGDIYNKLIGPQKTEKDF